MKRIFGLIILGAAVVIGLSMTAAARGDPKIVFTDVPGPQSGYGGIGTGLYHGTVGGGATSFICDDILNHMHHNDSWNATVFTLSNIAAPGNGYFAGTPFTATGDNILPKPSIQQDYNMAAYLA